MSLAACSPGLAANAAQVTIQLVEDYTDLSQQYLQQQYNQAHMGSEGVKGAVQFTRNSMQSMATGTQEESSGFIANGALQVGGQTVGYMRGHGLNSQIEGLNTRISNADNAIGHLEASQPSGPMLQRAEEGRQIPGSSFEDRFVKQQGFSYGDPVEAPQKGKDTVLGETESDLRKPPTAALKQEALDAAKEAKSNFQNQADKLVRDQENHQQWYASLGTAAGAIGQGAAAAEKAEQQNAQAQYDSANVAVKYLQDSSAASNNVASSAFETAKQHVTQTLQNAGSLAEVDNMRA